MKKFYLSIIALFVFSNLLPGQSRNAPDTLLIEPVLGDPTIMMLPAPSGDDQDWVNYDQDVIEGLCVDGDETPYGWYVERDFGVEDPDNDTNTAFTSCSYLVGATQNLNWLILPPIDIPDDSYNLCWRSLPFEGPAFMDGYKVLASTASNIPESDDFTDTLFVAAEMIKQLNSGDPTINPADYQFSPGYVHANGFTDTSYFYCVSDQGPCFGRMEPHCISLNGYAGKTVYIAFLHDSQDDSQLQLDDIIVTNVTTGTSEAFNLLDFEIMPNPAIEYVYVKWKLEKPEAGQLILQDQLGKMVLSKKFSANSNGYIHLNLQSLPPGIYSCTLQTASGIGVKKLMIRD
ncbi:MAG: T9SS type A sorting domain-containing protein [Saprospiraceae bacterium]